MAAFIKMLDSFKEGDSTLLDRSLLLANTDSNLAQIHQLRGIPIMTAGSAGGQLKTGIHVDGHGAPGTMVTLTAMRAMGLKLGEFGFGGNKVQQSVSEVVA